ncbi:uncharacterized protein LOC143024303 [Oratosquilla oratoria]|uniref:uncharacterized protein LOC143024303 n=1 Tax=Oratosquilla oratoria TaxID=337810 RepID=UPI003F75DBF5
MHRPMGPYHEWNRRVAHHRLFGPEHLPVNDLYGSSHHDSPLCVNPIGAGFPHPDYFHIYSDHRYRCNNDYLDVHEENNCNKHQRDQVRRNSVRREQVQKDQVRRDQSQSPRDQGRRDQSPRYQVRRNLSETKSKGSDSPLKTRRNERQLDLRCRTKPTRDLHKYKESVDVDKLSPYSTKPSFQCPKSCKRPISNLPSERKASVCTGKLIGQAVVVDHPDEGKCISSLDFLRPLKHYKYCLCIINTYVPDFCDGCKFCLHPVVLEYPPQPIDQNCKCGGTLWQITFDDKSYIICSVCALIQEYKNRYTFKYFIDHGAFVKKCEETPVQASDKKDVVTDEALQGIVQGEEPDISSDSQENTWAEQVEKTLDKEYDVEVSVKQKSAVNDTEDIHSSSTKIPRICHGRMVGESIAEENGKQNILFSFLPFSLATANIQRCTCILKSITEAFCDKCYVCHSKETPRAIAVYCSCGGQFCVTDNLEYRVCSRCGHHYRNTKRYYFSNERTLVKKNDKN